MTFNAPLEQAFAAVRGIIYYSTTMFSNFVYLNASDQVRHLRCAASAGDSDPSIHFLPPIFAMPISCRS
jgi:hypothetical protein